MTDDYLDGNVLAGPLNDVFELDITTMNGQCANCGDVAVLARAMVYGSPMGFVIRCSNCGDVLSVLVERTPRRRLALQGLRWIDVSDRP
jgi:ribosomal protein S27AE